MLYSEYLFSCVFEDEAVLPYYKGSTFRGVFGRALKKVVCALKREECSECLLKYKCTYSLVFETPSSTQESKDSRIASPPHPFVIESTLTAETHFHEGDHFDFKLLLFGQTNDYLPYFIYAFDQIWARSALAKGSTGKGLILPWMILKPATVRYILIKIRYSEGGVFARTCLYKIVTLHQKAPFG